jgi:hypothetical protein
MPKTGTSSIQRTLNRNYTTLLKHGVFYRYADFLYVLGNGGRAAEPLQIPSGCHTAIFSDEKLFKGVKRTGGAHRIVEELRTISDEITLVCYIRRQDEVFVSSYYTSILRGSTERFEERGLTPFDLESQLNLWESAVGRERMVIRRFGGTYLPDGVVADFLKIVGLENFGLPAPPRTNTSPRVDVLEAIRRINEEIDDPDRLALKVIADAVGTADPLGLSAEKRQKLVALAADANDELSSRYFEGAPLFTHAFPDDAAGPFTLDPARLEALGEIIGRDFGIEAGKCPPDIDQALRWLYRFAQRCADIIRDQASARQRKLQRRKAG